MVHKAKIGEKGETMPNLFSTVGSMSEYSKIHKVLKAIDLELHMSYSLTFRFRKPVVVVCGGLVTDLAGQKLDITRDYIMAPSYRTHKAC